MADPNAGKAAATLGALFGGPKARSPASVLPAPADPESTSIRAPAHRLIEVEGSGPGAGGGAYAGAGAEVEVERQELPGVIESDASRPPPELAGIASFFGGGVGKAKATPPGVPASSGGGAFSAAAHPVPAAGAAAGAGSSSTSPNNGEQRQAVPTATDTPQTKKNPLAALGAGGGKKSAIWAKARQKLEEKGTLRKRLDFDSLVANVVSQNKMETEEQALWRQKVVAQLEVEKEWRKRRDGVHHPSKLDDIYMHPMFETSVMFAVVLNLIIFSVESDVFDPDEAEHPRFYYFWWWSELMFFLIYLFDLVLRVGRCKNYFWRFYFPPRHLWDEAAFNWVDSFCLLTQVVELTAVSGSTAVGTAVLFKLLRLLRMSRLRKYEEVVVVFRTTQRVLIEIGPDLLIVSMVMLCFSVTLRQYVKYRDKDAADGAYSEYQETRFREAIMPIANTWFRTILVCLRLWLQDNSLPFIDLLSEQDWWISVWFIVGLLLSGVVLMNIVSGRVTKIMFEVVTEERRRRATVGMERFLKNLLITNGLLWFDHSSMTAEEEAAKGDKKQLTPAEQIVQHFEELRGSFKMDTSDIQTEEDLRKLTVKLYDLLLLPIALIRREYDEKTGARLPGYYMRRDVLNMPRQAYLNYLSQVEKHMVRKAFMARKGKELERMSKTESKLGMLESAKRSEQEQYNEVIRDIEGMVSVSAMNDVYQTLFDEGQMESVAVSLLQIQEEVAHTKRLLDAYVSHQQKDENAAMEMAYAKEVQKSIRG